MESKILIVDDEEMICSIFVKRLAKEGYVCLTARNGREALNLFYRDNISLIITDIKMPQMDGMDLLKSVKAINPNMMLIIMTSYPEIDMAIEAMRIGASDFIIKPAELDLVVFAVKKALDRRRLEEELDAYHYQLERLVEERTTKLQEAYRTLKKGHLDSVKVLVGAIDAKDTHTRGHSDRVSKMSVAIGKKLDFSEKKTESLEYGALLHDIGKIGIRDEILHKKESFTPEESRNVHEHPLIGVKIVEGIDFFKDKIAMIRHHHEHFDGSGYPDGLAGDAIPIEARIIAVSDAFDNRKHAGAPRGSMTMEDVLNGLQESKGRELDPGILEIFLKEKIYSNDI